MQALQIEGRLGRKINLYGRADNEGDSCACVFVNQIKIPFRKKRGDDQGLNWIFSLSRVKFNFFLSDFSDKKQFHRNKISCNESRSSMAWFTQGISTQSKALFTTGPEEDRKILFLLATLKLYILAHVALTLGEGSKILFTLLLQQRYAFICFYFKVSRN